MDPSTQYYRQGFGVKKNRTIVLVGPRCSGKSSVGRVLADLLGVACHDTDAMLERTCGMTLAAFVSRYGWEAFRRQETALLCDALEAAAKSGGVVCPGGGAILAEENRKQMQKGFVVYLEAPLSVLLARLAAEGEKEARPPLVGADSGEEFAEVLAFREPLYRQCAGVVVDASPCVEAVAAKIARLLTANGDT